MPRFSKKVIGAVDAAGDDVNAYEAERAARIEENKRRMMALGIFDTANALADAANAERVAARNARADAALANGGYNRRIERPAVKRRSGRLSGEVPKDYSAELDANGTNRDLWEPVYNEERYTLAHKEALGTSTKTWTLFVDGYDAKGNRIYDPVRGATCHQCRQKTVCKHTSCGGCGELRGQFCGDCLWMRYGEHVDEANDAGDAWRCPSCRDLCNCSFCRQRKGLPPTGTLYRRAIKEGFASVAHYLVLNNMAGDDDCGENDDRESPARVPETPEKETETEAETQPKTKPERTVILGVSPSKEKRRSEEIRVAGPETPEVKPKERRRRHDPVATPRKRSRVLALECDVVASAVAAAARPVEDEPGNRRRRRVMRA